MSTEEAILPFRTERALIPALTRVRSTLIGSSFLALRAAGLEEAYLAHLDPKHRDTILYTPAGVWLGLDASLAHYAACDRLNLADARILEIGSAVAKATQKSALASILRLARDAGTTPWSLYAKCDVFWARIFEGSGIGIFKIGPKDARFEVVSSPLCASSYWRVGLRGLLASVTEPFAHKVYARSLSQLTTSTSCAIRLSWA